MAFKNSGRRLDDVSQLAAVTACRLYSSLPLDKTFFACVAGSAGWLDSCLYKDLSGLVLLQGVCRTQPEIFLVSALTHKDYYCLISDTLTGKLSHCI